MQCINLENWTFCRYEKGDFMAMITFGANPESVKVDQLEYYVTVLEKEINEVFQASFESITDACIYLNENYGDWTFEDQTATKSGCSTCAAH
jgi:hypothetical protein